MKRGLKKVLIIMVGIILFLLLFLTLFPKVFWAVHNRNTERLQVELIEGQTELEYEYGQDLTCNVKEYQVKASDDSELEYIFIYPEELESSDNAYPVVVWGNGTGNTYVNYEAGLKSLASYGFIVVGCNDSNMGDGRVLYEMALYARDQNEEKDSIFYKKIKTGYIGVAGHSQGACGAVNAATKYEESQTLFASLYTTSLPKLEMCVDKKNMEFAYWKYDVSQIRIPYFATTGTYFLDSMWISPLSSMQENYDHLPDDISAVMARQIGANHNIVNEYHGSGYFNAWFCLTLKDDENAGRVFEKTKELEQNTGRWKDFASKGPKLIVTKSGCNLRVPKKDQN